MDNYNNKRRVRYGISKRTPGANEADPTGTIYGQTYITMTENTKITEELKSKPD